MTSEEAIMELKQFSGTTRLRLSANFWEALNSAIKALEEPCEDAISRQALLNMYECLDEESRVYAGQVVKDVKALPPVTPTRKKGKWIEDYIPLPLSDGSKKCYQCSECRTHWDNVFNCCPNCGAEMETEE